MQFSKTTKCVLAIAGCVFASASATVASGATNGSIVAWGRNTSGQTDVPAPNTDFAAVAAGYGHGLGLKTDGSIVAWGLNNYGQRDVPAPNTNLVAVAAGGLHSLGLKADGSIVAWGCGDPFNHGQCDLPAPNTDFVEVSAGAYHSLGLKADRSIVAWGWNGNGQCNVPAPNTDFVAVAAGWFHSLGLKADGSVVAWGRNDDGQCDVPAANTDFVAVAAADGHSLGLKADGSIVAWGRNNHGQCDVPVPNTDFVAVAGDGGHSLGLKADGSVVAWGDNGDGQSDVPVPNADFVAVAAGGYHSLGLRGASCGDGVVDIGEDCEPPDSDCCDALCHFEPDGIPCRNDLYCDGDESCQAGECANGPEPCVDLDHCDEDTDSCFTGSVVLSVGDLSLVSGATGDIVVSGDTAGQVTFGVTILVELVPRAGNMGSVTFTLSPPADVAQAGDPWPSAGTFSAFDTDSPGFSDTVNGAVDDNGMFVCDTPNFTGPLASFPVISSVDAEGVWDFVLSTSVGDSAWECVSTPLTTMLISGTVTVAPLECAVDADCNDGAFCNGEETCQSGECADGPDPCVDLDHCDEDRDRCLSCIDDAECNDDNPCTADACIVNICVHTTIPDCQACMTGDQCEDGNPCTDDVCLQEGELPGVCLRTNLIPGSPCPDDGNPCTDDVCDGAGTCEHPNDDTNDCDDDEFCNGDESCQSGECVDGPEPCMDMVHCDEIDDVCLACVGDDECIDDDPCTDDACIENLCVHTPRTDCGALVHLDIKPGSCPNPFNARSKGVVPMAIVGSESFDVTQIDVDLLVLARADGVGGTIAPLRGRRGPSAHLADVATPFDGEVCDCHELSGDGFYDLLLKFSTAELTDSLELGSVRRREAVMLTLSGSLLDGSAFDASDCIVIVGKLRTGIRSGR